MSVDIIDIKGILERNHVALPILPNEIADVYIDYCSGDKNQLQFKISTIRKTDSFQISTADFDLLTEELLKAKIEEMQILPRMSIHMEVIFDNDQNPRLYGINTVSSKSIYYKNNFKNNCRYGENVSEVIDNQTKKKVLAPVPEPMPNIIPTMATLGKIESGEQAPLETKNPSPVPVTSEPILQTQQVPVPVPESVPESVPVPVPESVPVPVPESVPVPVPVPESVPSNVKSSETRIPQNDIVLSRDDGDVPSHKASPINQAGDLIKTTVEPFVPPPPRQAFMEEPKKDDIILDPKENVADKVEDKMQVPTDEPRKLLPFETEILSLIEKMILLLEHLNAHNATRNTSDNILKSVETDYSQLISKLNKFLTSPPPYLDEPGNEVFRNNFYKFNSQWFLIKNRLDDIHANLIRNTWDLRFSFLDKAETYLEELIKIRNILKLYLFGEPDEEYKGGRRRKRKRRTKRTNAKAHSKNKTNSKRNNI